MGRAQNPEWIVPLERIKVRCRCGRILAFWTKEGFTLKCRRCERTILIPITLLQNGGEVSVDLHSTNETMKGGVIAS
jgi:hypothetical protein